MKKLLSLTAIKVVVLSLAAVVLTVNIYSVTRINDINKSFSTRQNEATWFVFQLVKEYANFLMVSRSETIDYDELWLAYDITWSRFDILINSTESSNFIKSANFKPYFTSEFDKFKSLESSIKLVSEGLLPKESLQKKVDICYHTLVDFINDKFRLQSPVIEENTSMVDNLVTVHRISSVFLVVILLMTGGIFYVDYSIKRKLYTTDFITGFRNRISLMKFVKNSYPKDNNFDLYFVRIRNLTEINQKYGLEYGDLVVSSAAKSLTAKIPESTISFRSSGSQFLFFIPDHLYASDEIQEKFNDVLSDYISAGNLELMIDAVVRHKKNISSKDMMELLTSMQG
ncbi:diguanylate cyclase domain-containing protein [Vibrio crassostreae]|uniref:diguanylate cyclase domain-containing protein n=1 Tax=Vibrio crassostreae TaxID=246167 RepID=UPI000F47CB00|nr:diguanylate cyclase [Vibrio crassostreae]ROP20613.1 diguanylate cyclase with GGDEF domain [Vibrio crassostreae]ROP21998.1 diguanylate cyclase with GGDEF domain [Vibrio crassostreae]RPE95597.1 diguanylate cyclase with GGDEF domain [Vibrio crassostreae]TCN68769.1 diguanylate cyclase with GGDEF domain [Vibrio crassostreae]TCV13956.1 diguanylate cyclase with GGDEF domain [Vibrio crassostreae]